MLTSMHQVSRSIEVDVAAETFMRVLCDFQHYPQFLSNVLAVKVLEQVENRWRVWFEVVLFRRNVEYTLDLTRETEHKLSWVLVQGDWMTNNSGSWTLTPIGEQTTRAVYSIQVVIDGILPHAVSSLLIDASIPRLLRDFKRWAERYGAVSPEES